MIKDTDKGYKNFVKNMMKNAGISADVGIFEGEIDNEGLSVAKYASDNEYGTKKIPSRPFTRLAFDENESKAYKVIQTDIKRNLLYTNYNLKRSVGVGAEFLAGKIKEKIKTAIAWAERNADSTIDIKGKNRPLIKDGIMWKAVHWRYTTMRG